MAKVTTTPVDPSCPPLDPLHRDFEERFDDPELELKRRDFYRDFLAILDIDLGEAKAAARKAITRLIPGYFGRYIESLLLASFEYLSYLQHDLIPRLVGYLNILVNNWHRYLDEAVTPGPPPERYVLLAFSVIEDQSIVLTQDELDRFIDEAARRENLDRPTLLRKAQVRAELGRNAKGGRLDDEVWDCIDLVAHIILLMKRPGLKPSVRDPELQNWLIHYFATSRSAKKTVGGAAGNEAYVLRQLNLSVLVHTPYHHTEQAIIAAECARRLVFAEGEPIRPFRSLNAGDPDAARRFSFVLQLTPELDKQGNVIGPTLVKNGHRLQPLKADRVIPRIPNPRGEKPAPWKKLRVEWRGKGPWNKRNRTSAIRWDASKRCWFIEIDRDERDASGNKVFRDFSEYDWPWLPVFQHRPVFDSTTGALTITLASADQIGQIVDEVRRVLLGGLQALGKTLFTAPLCQFLREVVVKQLKVFSSHSVPLHFELSGVDSAAALDELKKLFARAGIRHLGINREELVQITCQHSSAYFAWPKSFVPERAFLIYQRGVRLLAQLRLHTLYIHDLEMDILLRRNSPEETEQEVRSALEKHRQAMLLAKAAVPAALLRRAGVNVEWDLVLSGPSLLALLAFADEYANMVAVTIHGVARDDVFKSIVEKGYYCNPEKDGISVVVAPAIQVDFPEAVSLAGAGDMCFAVHAADV